MNQRDGRPNILVIMTDQQQASTVRPESGCKTPAADRLAREGIRFNRAYTTTALCAPARASFFSGLYPNRHGIINNYHTKPYLHESIYDDVRLFIENLKDAGYDTYHSGKWHVTGGKTPKDFGAVELNTTDSWSKSNLMDESILLNRNKNHTKDTKIIKRRNKQDYYLYGTSTLEEEKGRDYDTGSAIKKQIQNSAGSDEPWFMFTGFIGPHDPFIIPEKYARMYDWRDIPKPANYEDDLSDKPNIYKRHKKDIWGSLTWEECAKAIAHYWGYIHMVEDYTNEILDALEETGQAENTLVIYISDHGDMAGAHGGLFLKGVLPFEECYNIPLIMRWPKGIKNTGRTCDEFVRIIDLAPTFLEIADAAPLKDISGISMLSLLNDTVPADWPKEFYGQFDGTEYFYTQRILVDQQFKYVFNGFDFDELYDLKNDPHEMVNLADKEEFYEDKVRLVKKLWKWMNKEDDYYASINYPTVSLFPVDSIFAD